MSYATGSITSTTPAKDLMAALGTQIVAGGLTLVETYASPASASWTAVTYGGGVYVAVASGTATAATSTDGITWTQRTLPVSGSWSAVTYGGSQFVAIASGSTVAATSPDGITWTQRTLPSSLTWVSLAYGSGVFVALAASTSTALSSADGITWTARTLPAAVGWSSVTYGSSKFLAVSATTQAATSPDGITWTTRSLPASSNWSSATSNGTTFLVVPSGNATAVSSTDGITWVNRTMPSATNWSSVTYGGGLFVAVSIGGGAGTAGSASAASSPDGITWTARTLPTNSTWTAVASGTSLFVALSTGSPIAASSSDAITWTQRTMTATSASPTADVYKSAAASNGSGADWYLILRRASETGTGLFYQVAESYDATNHLMSNYGGLGLTSYPVPGTFRNPANATTPDVGGFGSAASLTLTTTAFSYWVSANTTRVIIGVKTSVDLGAYLGLYDDLLPSGVTQYPLVGVKFPTNQTSAQAMGNNTALAVGGFTREPAPRALETRNFEAVIYNGFIPFLGVALTGYSYMPVTTTSALYGNTSNLTPVMIGSGRSVPTSMVNDAVRGLLNGCLLSTVVSASGDTATVGGKTYVRFCGPGVNNFGFFVDNSL